MNYEKLLSKRVVSLPFSGIRKYFDLAEEYDDVISLGVGEPDFDMPEKYKQAGIRHLENNNNRYTSNAGMKELRTTIARYLAKKFGLDYKEDEIIVTNGTSEALDTALRAFIEDGDEVIVPSPMYVAYNPDIVLTGGKTVEVETRLEDGFKLTPDLLKKAITKRSKVLLLPYPNNPTGAIMEREDLEKIIPIIKENDLIVITDEVYAELTYGGKHHCSIATLDGMKERTVTISGVSKSFAMTGWRIGYVAAPLPIISQILKIHQYVAMCSSTIGQYVTKEALQDGFDNDFYEIHRMVAEYDRRRQYLLKEFKNMGLDCFNAEGAFYLFPSVKSLNMDGEEFAEALIKEERVAVVPGIGFGKCGKDYIRVSYAYSMETLEKAIERIKRFIKNHKK